MKRYLKCPAEIYSSSCRPHPGISEPHYPFHDKTVVVTNCGRLCVYRKKINLSTCLAGQAVGIKEVDDGIWLVNFMDYDLVYIDLEEKTLQEQIPQLLKELETRTKECNSWKAKSCFGGDGSIHLSYLPELDSIE